MGSYEAFFYGRPASTITGIDQTSIFIGTPNRLNNNINNLWLLTGVNSNRSIGSSYNILSQFIEANRWYNASLASADMNVFNLWACPAVGEEYRFPWYVYGALGGNTPLNLGSSWTTLELINKRYDLGRDHLSLDIGWSQRVNTPQWQMFAENLQGWFLQKLNLKFSK